MTKKKIGVVTISRSDYGIYKPLLKSIDRDPELKLILYVSGMHLSPNFGLTIREIEEDKYKVDEKVEMLLSSDTPEGVAKAIGLGILGFSQAFSHNRPDILIVLGDRFEMFAAASASLPLKIPLAHIHGGEVTEGSLDETFRHSITKMSHLHFVSTDIYAQRVIQMGEEPWRVVNSGALSIDNIKDTFLLDRKSFEKKFKLKLPKEFVIVTFHPDTLNHEQTEWQFNQLLSTLEHYDTPVFFTMPNADMNNQIIRDAIENFLLKNPSSLAYESLGTQGYFSLMNLAKALIGNSSSGIVEASMYKLPVINIGTRQKGRIRSQNIIDVNYPEEEILAGLKKAESPTFLQELPKVNNPFGDGNAAKKIIETLKNTPLNNKILNKKFVDLKK